MKNKVIQLKKVHKSYFIGTMELEVLKGITLDIFQNDYVAIMGSSGSGKSTLMNALGCLDTITSGEYILNGHNVKKITDENLAKIRNKEIGFVFQMFNLLAPYTAIDNVALPLIYAGINKKERDDRARKILTEVGLGDRMEHKPNELSGGQQQRIAIARALINNPAIILADEPTGNLDSTTTLEIMELFQKIHSKGNTVIFITHENDICQYAHRIITLKDGKIKEDRKNETPRVILN